MKVTNLLIGLGLSAMVLPTNFGLGGQEALGPKSVVLRPKGEGSVAFPHGRHQQVLVNCKPCHELFPKEAQGIEKMRAAGKLQAKEVMTMCRNCHQTLVSKGEKAGPTGCKGCHQK